MRGYQTQILRIQINIQYTGLKSSFLFIIIPRSVPQIRPPFCNLSLSTKCRGGLYAGCDDFSRDYAPPPPPPPPPPPLIPIPIKHDLIVVVSFPDRILSRPPEKWVWSTAYSIFVQVRRNVGALFFSNLTLDVIDDCIPHCVRTIY